MSWHFKKNKFKQTSYQALKGSQIGFDLFSYYLPFKAKLKLVLKLQCCVN